MISLKCTSLGQAWTSAMEIIMRAGESIYDENVELKEIRNCYITIDNIDDLDPIIVKYADKNRVELMKKICYLWFGRRL